MSTDVIVLKPAHERPALRLPRPSMGRGGGASAARPASAAAARPVVRPSGMAAVAAVAAVDTEPGTSRAVELLLTAGSLLGAVVLALTVFAAQTGLRPMVVRSGSMEPTISTGAMVLMREVPASEIKQGDIVSVERPDHTRVTHRVMKVERQGAKALLTLKGDANEDVDPAPVAVETAYAYVFSIDFLGRLTSWLATAQGGFLMGSLVTAIAMAVLRRRPRGNGGAGAPAPAVRRVAV